MRRLAQNIFYWRDESDVDIPGKIKINCNVEISLHPLGKGNITFWLKESPWRFFVKNKE